MWRANPGRAPRRPDTPGRVTASSIIAALRASLDWPDVAGATRHAYSKNGASANVGGDALRAAALEAEESGQSGDLGAIIARMPDLESQFARLTDAIHDFTGSEEPEPREKP